MLNVLRSISERPILCKLNDFPGNQSKSESKQKETVFKSVFEPFALCSLRGLLCENISAIGVHIGLKLSDAKRFHEVVAFFSEMSHPCFSTTRPARRFPMLICRQGN